MRNLRFASLSLLIACTAGTPKAPPTDDPDVDDAKADSVRYPTMQSPFAPGSTAAGNVTTSHKYLGWPIHLDAGQTIDLWVGGADDAGGTLDTVAYLYRPKDVHGLRGSYLVRDDDWSDDSYASRFAWTAATSGDYLLVATTYTKPDPGQVFVTSDCVTCVPNAPTLSPLDARTLADPELLAARSIDDTLALLDRDAADGDPLTIASDIASLGGSRKWPLDQVDRVYQAIRAALPDARTFGDQWPGRAQSIVLSTDRVLEPVTTSQKPSIDAPLAALLAAMPGFTEKDAEPTAFGLGGQVYGFVVELSLTNDNGDLWRDRLYFDGSGAFLGDGGGDFDDPD
jgi:hypothetical protein